MDTPQHIAIIMDGNGRWAKKRNLPKVMGHKEGVETAARVAEICAERGVKALTLYTFSTENWKRPQKEVNALMSLLEENLKSGWKKLNENNIKFNVIGRLDQLSVTLRDEICRVMRLTAENTGLTLSLAINYGGRQEIFDAARIFSQKIYARELDADAVDEDDFAACLYTSNLPDLDLIIRTSGEKRLSNFLLWQAAYSEIYLTDVLWPDFGAQEMELALEDYKKRERRFGG